MLWRYWVTQIGCSIVEHDLRLFEDMKACQINFFAPERNFVFQTEKDSSFSVRWTAHSNWGIAVGLTAYASTIMLHNNDFCDCFRLYLMEIHTQRFNPTWLSKVCNCSIATRLDHGTRKLNPAWRRNWIIYDIRINTFDVSVKYICNCFNF